MPTLTHYADLADRIAGIKGTDSGPSVATTSANGPATVR